MRHNVKRNLSLLLISVVMMATVLIQPMATHAAESVDLKADSAILVDAETGKILYAKEADMALPPASMTKMMTEYLVWEAIESGQISWDTTTKISDYAYSISANPNLSGIGLRQDKEYTVKELYRGMAIISDNGRTIALAELIAGSETDFVKLMNKTAEKMGLPDYKFVNSTGLPNSLLGEYAPKGTDPKANNLLSARSAALLAYNLINEHPEALKVSSELSVDIGEYKDVENLNWMLPHKATFLKQFHYKGVDGLKTGHTDIAGYCFTGTAERNGQRLISVVMKTDSKAERFEQTAKLLDFGFSSFETKELFPKGYQLDGQAKLPVADGKKDNVEIATNKAIKIPVQKGQEDKYTIKYTLDKKKLNKAGELAAPIEKGEKVGTAEVIFAGENDYGYIFDAEANKTIDIVAQDSVEKDNWFMLILGSIGDFFSNLFSTIVDTVKGWF
ncbi:D-alanyl-D-alanine carboxypeptidase [Virgibacillus phasianinus]|uniref:serine-type D-Ala-D-Ala carboxypeptidase n=1 Tax=Virgibacillus phasianinus TaxID=2017483 RepID=A0A220U1T8_9BACI|nr:serine hydrolase [Virgibacillus phasianinus]ASK61753.1 D-alanyl-D-alanine carboxypeptidase [Virgibacillus phasianinus]